MDFYLDRSWQICQKLFEKLNFTEPFIARYYDRPAALDETSKCVKLYCLKKNMEDFHSCYGRCLRFVVEGLASVPHFFVTPPKRQVDPLQSCIEAKCAGLTDFIFLLQDCLNRRYIVTIYLVH